ncbi:MAG: hypothetical protein VW830_06560, partial [Rhodobiaceae bacterium]
MAEDVKKTILFCHAAARSTLISRRQLAVQLGGDDIKGLRRADAGNGPGFTEPAVRLGYRYDRVTIIQGRRLRKNPGRRPAAGGSDVQQTGI